jgi:tripartite-type tricarboxylate transporter receptor subunit TctC
MFRFLSAPARLAHHASSCVASLALALGAATASMPAHADDASSYPNHLIRFIVPYAAGGLPDTVARIVASRLTTELGQSVVVENKPGANGVVAAGALASSAKDGYTFIVTDGSMVSINPALYPNLSYQPKRDFTPVSLIASSPLFLATTTKTGINSLDDLVKRAKAAPGRVDYGSSGIGSSHHLSMEALDAAMGIQMTHVPFKGTGQSVPALMSGQVNVVFAALPSLSGFVEKGEMKILAANSDKRSVLAPNIPALGETIPGYNFAVSIGVLGAKGVPDYAVERLSKAIAKVVAEPEVVKHMATLGIESIGGNAAQYEKVLDDETSRYATVIKSANVKLQ